MPQYISPGVYVEEVPPLSRPIAGVSTSTPGFIGVLPDKVKLPARPLSGEKLTFRWVEYKVNAAPLALRRITSWNDYVKWFGDFVGGNATPTWDVVTEGSGATAKTFVSGTTNAGLTVTVTYNAGGANPSTKTASGSADGNGSFKIEIDSGTAKDSVTSVTTTVDSSGAAVDANQRNLAHAVYGFFNNGGGSCYVIRVASADDLDKALAKLAAEDEISMVAAPGWTTATAYTKLTAHCETLEDRVAILDSVENLGNPDYSGLKTPLTGNATVGRPANSNAAAFYFPWLQVFDPATALMTADKKEDGLIFVPPSGFIAGVYARSDAQRGVFKAPANEALRGVTGVKYALSKEDQKGLNDVGVNLIRPLIGAFRVWGARTVGGDANGEYRYISTRRYFNYLRESIDKGTQFVVFEPNTPALWQRINRTLTDFLTNEWRAGALFGESAKQAFYVKCDADTNPASEREAGRVITEIGVAIVKPAEFVIFRIQQTTGG